MANIEVLTVTIANGQSLSSAVDLGDRILLAVQMPASWTAAQLSFQASNDGSNFGTLKDFSAPSGASPEIATVGNVGGGDYVALGNIPDAIWRSVGWLKVRSGSASAPTNQGAERTVYLITKPGSCSLSVSC